MKMDANFVDAMIHLNHARILNAQIHAQMVTEKIIAVRRLQKKISCFE
jgi:hypothetical protein